MLWFIPLILRVLANAIPANYNENGPWIQEPFTGFLQKVTENLQTNWAIRAIVEKAKEFPALAVRTQL